MCCRSTPLQKAEMVGFVKRNLKKVTLAIGDGGNDVNMIQEAHIGVGIMGKEGHQAAYASDYSFSKFKFLWRLILIHGRWNYYRLANFIYYFLYKNIFFTMPNFWFAFYSGFSGQSFFDDYYIMNFNTTLTAIGPVYYAALDQDVNPKDSKIIQDNIPELYKIYRKKDLFSYGKFIVWSVYGILHSLVAFYLIQGTFNGVASDSYGRTFDFWMQSITSFTVIFSAVVDIMYIGTNSFTVVTAVCYILFTIVIYFPSMYFVVDRIRSSVVYGIGIDVLGNLKFWLTAAVAMTICALSFYVPKLYMQYFNPTLVDYLRYETKKYAFPLSPRVVHQQPEFEMQHLKDLSTYNSISHQANVNVRELSDIKSKK